MKDIFARADALDLDTSSYSIWGASAGGYVASSFGTESLGYKKYGFPMPAALVLSYPVITMGEKTHLGTRKFYLGKKPGEDLARRTSVEKNVTPAYPPTFIWCGDADTVVDPANSRMLSAAMEVYGIDHELVVYPGIGHGVGLGTGLSCEDWFERAVRFWEKQRI